MSPETKTDELDQAIDALADFDIIVPDEIEYEVAQLKGLYGGMWYGVEARQKISFHLKQNPSRCGTLHTDGTKCGSVVSPGHWRVTLFYPEAWIHRNPPYEMVSGEFRDGKLVETSRSSSEEFENRLYAPRMYEFLSYDLSPKRIASDFLVSLWHYGCGSSIQPIREDSQS